MNSTNSKTLNLLDGNYLHLGHKNYVKSPLFNTYRHYQCPCGHIVKGTGNISSHLNGKNGCNVKNGTKITVEEVKANWINEAELRAADAVYKENLQNEELKQQVAQEHEAQMDKIDKIKSLISEANKIQEENKILLDEVKTRDAEILRLKTLLKTVKCTMDAKDEEINKLKKNLKAVEHKYYYSKSVDAKLEQLAASVQV